MARRNKKRGEANTPQIIMSSEAAAAAAAVELLADLGHERREHVLLTDNQEHRVLPMGGTLPSSKVEKPAPREFRASLDAWTTMHEEEDAEVSDESLQGGQTHRLRLQQDLVQYKHGAPRGHATRGGLSARGGRGGGNAGRHPGRDSFRASLAYADDIFSAPPRSAHKLGLGGSYGLSASEAKDLAESVAELRRKGIVIQEDELTKALEAEGERRASKRQAARDPVRQPRAQHSRSQSLRPAANPRPPYLGNIHNGDVFLDDAKARFEARYPKNPFRPVAQQGSKFTKPKPPVTPQDIGSAASFTHAGATSASQPHREETPEPKGEAEDAAPARLADRLEALKQSALGLEDPDDADNPDEVARRAANSIAVVQTYLQHLGQRNKTRLQNNLLDDDSGNEKLSRVTPLLPTSTSVATFPLEEKPDPVRMGLSVGAYEFAQSLAGLEFLKEPTPPEPNGGIVAQDISGAQKAAQATKGLADFVAAQAERHSVSDSQGSELSDSDSQGSDANGQISPKGSSQWHFEVTAQTTLQAPTAVRHHSSNLLFNIHSPRHAIDPHPARELGINIPVCRSPASQRALESLHDSLSNLAYVDPNTPPVADQSAKLCTPSKLQRSQDKRTPLGVGEGQARALTRLAKCEPLAIPRGRATCLAIRPCQTVNHVRRLLYFQDHAVVQIMRRSLNTFVIEFSNDAIAESTLWAFLNSPDGRTRQYEAMVLHLSDLTHGWEPFAADPPSPSRFGRNNASLDMVDPPDCTSWYVSNAYSISEVYDLIPGCYADHVSTVVRVRASDYTVHFFTHTDAKGALMKTPLLLRGTGPAIPGGPLKIDWFTRSHQEELEKRLHNLDPGVRADMFGPPPHESVRPAEQSRWSPSSSSAFSSLYGQRERGRQSESPILGRAFVDDLTARRTRRALSSLPPLPKTPTPNRAIPRSVHGESTPLHQTLTSADKTSGKVESPTTVKPSDKAKPVHPTDREAESPSLRKGPTKLSPSPGRGSGGPRTFSVTLKQVTEHPLSLDTAVDEKENSPKVWTRKDAIQALVDHSQPVFGGASRWETASNEEAAPADHRRSVVSGLSRVATATNEEDAPVESTRSVLGGTSRWATATSEEDAGALKRQRSHVPDSGSSHSSRGSGLFSNYHRKAHVPHALPEWLIEQQRQNRSFRKVWEST